MIKTKENMIFVQGGINIYAKEYGDKHTTKRTPVVCLSGLVRTSSDFDSFARYFAEKEGFYVVALDYRGRGKSNFAKWKHYRAQYILNDIVSVLNALHIDKALFVGTSFGGILSMALNALMPNRVAGVVMNDIGPEFGTNGLDRIKAYVAQDHPQKSWEEAVLHMKGLFPNLRFKDEDGWMEMTKGTFKEGSDGYLHVQWDPEIAKTMGVRKTDPDLWGLYKSLKNKPVLAIRGGVSDVLTPDTFDKMAEVKPDLVRVEVEGVGHCPLFDEPAVVKKLGPFLKHF